MATRSQLKSDADEIRGRVHRMWGAVAESWGEHADSVEVRAAEMTRLMIEAVAPVPGEEVLELACGAGGLGLAISDLVAPGGRVVLSDVAPQMVAIAAVRAASRVRGSEETRVDTRVLDMERVDVADSTFDIVVCREGLMFALDPVRATREVARVLRPGGRAALAVWGPRDRNPWLGVLADALAEHTATPVPPPGTPGPFSMGTDGALAEALTAAGLEDVRITAVDLPTHDRSFDDYWRVRTDLAGPLKKRLAALPADQLATVRDVVRTRLSPYRTSEGLTIPGLAYLGSARRPG
jgi:ubiquinone/menaquinone biosynthesis C-methylase UbiE